MQGKKISKLPTTKRSGTFYRVYKPDYSDPPSATSHSKAHGGRWNPAGEFGALYLNATVAVAAAQVRHMHRDRAIKLFDLLPQRRPLLATFDVPSTVTVDAVSAEALRHLDLPAHFPHGTPWEPCQAIARQAHQEQIAGVATRSNAEATVTSFVGEELALFDSHPLPQMIDSGRVFSEWYPDPIP